MAVHLALADHPLQLGVGSVGLGHDQQARGVAIEAVHDPRALGVLSPGGPPRQGLGERARVVPRARVHHHAGGLVHHQQVLVLEHHLEGHGLGHRLLRRRGVGHRDHLPFGHAVGLRPLAAVHADPPLLHRPLARGAGGRQAAGGQERVQAQPGVLGAGARPHSGLLGPSTT